MGSGKRGFMNDAQIYDNLRARKHNRGMPRCRMLLDTAPVSHTM